MSTTKTPPTRKSNFEGAFRKCWIKNKMLLSNGCRCSCSSRWVGTKLQIRIASGDKIRRAHTHTYIQYRDKYGCGGREYRLCGCACRNGWASEHIKRSISMQPSSKHYKFHSGQGTRIFFGFVSTPLDLFFFKIPLGILLVAFRASLPFEIQFSPFALAQFNCFALRTFFH